jgi:glycerate 2-kinase
VVRPEKGELNPLFARFRRDLPAIFRAALDASSSARLIGAACGRSDVRDFLGRPVHVLAVGKAAAHLVSALARLHVASIADGLAIGTHRADGMPTSIVWMDASHPVPDDRSVEAARRAVALARQVPAGHGLLVLISGGASSLAALPAEGVTLADKQAATRQLLLAGADIHSLNGVRKHLSAIKGGRLAEAAHAPVLALAISDVVGDDLSVVGSGPTVEDPSTFLDALESVRRFGGAAAFPVAVVERLEAGARGRVAETPKPGDGRLAHATTRLIGSRANAAAGAAAAAESLGYRTVIIEEPVVGVAREAGPRFVAGAARRAAETGMSACVIGTGETTVRVSGRGLGGRNQELVLAAVRALAGLRVHAALLSGGTDGIDGPTDAAGAMADGLTLERSVQAGLHAPEEYLGDNDSYRFFQAVGDLVVTGPTDTNVGDVQILLVAGGGRVENGA